MLLCDTSFGGFCLQHMESEFGFPTFLDGCRLERAAVHTVSSSSPITFFWVGACLDLWFCSFVGKKLFSSRKRSWCPPLMGFGCGHRSPEASSVARLARGVHPVLVTAFWKGWSGTPSPYPKQPIYRRSESQVLEGWSFGGYVQLHVADVTAL